MRTGFVLSCGCSFLPLRQEGGAYRGTTEVQNWKEDRVNNSWCVAPALTPDVLRDDTKASPFFFHTTEVLPGGWVTPIRLFICPNRDLYLLWICSLIGRQDHIPQAVHLIVDGHARRVGFVPGNRAAHAFSPQDFAFEIGHKTLDLAVVEDHAVDLVADQAAQRARVIGRNQLRSDMDDVHLQAEGFTDFQEDLVPRKHLVGGHVEGLPDGILPPKQADQPFGEVAVPGDRPQRGAVAGDDDLFALADAIDDSVRMLPACAAQRDLRWPVGQRRADDRDGEPVFAVFLQQAFFDGDLVA